MNNIRQCPAGHLSLGAANWECPWCELDEWRETARSEMAGRRAAEAEVERLKRDLTAVIGAAQRFQPAGSPPPVSSEGLVLWVCRSLNERAEAAEAKLAEAQGVCVSCDKPGAILCRQCARAEFEQARIDRDEAVSQAVSIGRESKKLEAALKSAEAKLAEAQREPYRILWAALERAGITRADGCPDIILIEEVMALRAKVERLRSEFRRIEGEVAALLAGEPSYAAVLRVLHEAPRAGGGEYAVRLESAIAEWRKHDSAPDCVACAALDAALAGGGE